MGQLHERMAEDLRLRGLSPSTGSNSDGRGTHHCQQLPLRTSFNSRL
jgi:hypothetical protein